MRRSRGDDVGWRGRAGRQRDLLGDADEVLEGSVSEGLEGPPAPGLVPQAQPDNAVRPPSMRPGQLVPGAFPVVAMGDAGPEDEGGVAVRDGASEFLQGASCSFRAEALFSRKIDGGSLRDRQSAMTGATSTSTDRSATSRSVGVARTGGQRVRLYAIWL